MIQNNGTDIAQYTSHASNIPGCCMHVIFTIFKNAFEAVTEMQSIVIANVLVSWKAEETGQISMTVILQGVSILMSWYYGLQHALRPLCTG